MNEHNHQKIVVSWFRTSYPGRIIYAIPNGGRRNEIEASRLKGEGVLAGMPDLHIPYGTGRYLSLYVEMKTTMGRMSVDQKKRRKELMEAGNDVFVGRGYVATTQYIAQYMAEVEKWKSENAG